MKTKAKRNSLYAITTGTGNIAIGDRANEITTTGVDNIIIGSDIDPSSASASNELNIGGTLYGNVQSASIKSIGIGVIPTSITARLHLPAGTATASTAPLKFISGTLLTTAEAGAVEFLTDKGYLTITTGAARKEVTLNDIALTSGRIPFATTNGRLTDDSDLTFATDTLTANKIVGSTSIKAGSVAGFISSDGSTGASGTFTTTDLKTVTVKDGIITNIV